MSSLGPFYFFHHVLLTFSFLYRPVLPEPVMPRDCGREDQSTRGGSSALSLLVTRVQLLLELSLICSLRAALWGWERPGLGARWVWV